MSAQWRTAGSRRERLRRDPCGEGFGRHPEALAVQLNHNQTWKCKMKTKLGKLVKFMRSLEGETSTVLRAVCICVCAVNTVYYLKHYRWKVITVMCYIRSTI